MNNPENIVVDQYIGNWTFYCGRKNQDHSLLIECPGPGLGVFSFQLNLVLVFILDSKTTVSKRTPQIPRARKCSINSKSLELKFEAFTQRYYCEKILLTMSSLGLFCWPVYIWKSSFLHFFLSPQFSFFPQQHTLKNFKYIVKLK
jgi:hypothetical protein